MTYSSDGRILFAPTGARVSRWDIATGRYLGYLTEAGPGSSWNRIALSPDGKMLLVGGWEMAQPRLYDAQTGKPMPLSMVGPQDNIAIAFSPDGKCVLAGGVNGWLRRWNVATGQPLGEPFRHKTQVLSVAFSPDGRSVAVGGSDNMLWQYGAETWAPIAPPLQLHGHVMRVSYSRDGQLILTGSEDGTARLWHPKTGMPVGPPLRHENRVMALALSPDNETVATGGTDGAVSLWSMPRREAGSIDQVVARIECLTGLRLDDDGVPHRLDADEWWQRGGREAVAPNPKEVIALAMNARAALGADDVIGYRNSCAALAGHAVDAKDDALWLAAARVCVLAPDAGPDLTPLLAAAEKVGNKRSQAGLLLRMGRAAEAVPLLEESRKERAAGTVYEELLLSLAYQQMGKPGEAKKWLVQAEAWLDEPRQAEDAAALAGALVGGPWPALGLAPTTREAASLGDLGSEEGQDVHLLRREAENRARLGEVWGLAYAPDGLTLASGSGGPAEPGALVLWDLAAGRPRLWLEQPLGVRAVAFSSDGKKVATGGWDQVVRLYDAHTGKLDAALTGHSNLINTLTFSPDGTVLASGSLDKTIILWDVAKGTELRRLTGHTDWVLGVAFFPDGLSLASGGKDGTLRVWDVPTGKERRAPSQLDNAVETVAVSPDGHTIASGGWDRTVRLWDAETGAAREVPQPAHGREVGRHLARRQDARLGQRPLGPARRRRSQTLECAGRPGADDAGRPHGQHLVGALRPGRPNAGDGRTESENQDLGCIDRQGAFDADGRSGDGRGVRPAEVNGPRAAAPPSGRRGAAGVQSVGVRFGRVGRGGSGASRHRAGQAKVSGRQRCQEPFLGPKG